MPLQKLSHQLAGNYRMQLAGNSPFSMWAVLTINKSNSFFMEFRIAEKDKPDLLITGSLSAAIRHWEEI